MAFHVAVGQDVLWFQTGFLWQLSPCWIHKEHPCGSEDETSPSPPVLLFLKQVFGLVFSRVSVSFGSGNSLLTDLASKHRNESSHNSRGQKFKVRIAGLESGCHRSVLLWRLGRIHPLLPPGSWLPASLQLWPRHSSLCLPCLITTSSSVFSCLLYFSCK